MMEQEQLTTIQYNEIPMIDDGIVTSTTSPLLSSSSTTLPPSPSSVPSLISLSPRSLEIALRAEFLHDSIRRREEDSATMKSLSDAWSHNRVGRREANMWRAGQEREEEERYNEEERKRKEKIEKDELDEEENDRDGGKHMEARKKMQKMVKFAFESDDDNSDDDDRPPFEDRRAAFFAFMGSTPQSVSDAAKSALAARSEAAARATAREAKLSSDALAAAHFAERRDEWGKEFPPIREADTITIHRRIISRRSPHEWDQEHKSQQKKKVEFAY